MAKNYYRKNFMNLLEFLSVGVVSETRVTFMFFFFLGLSVFTFRIFFQFFLFYFFRINARILLKGYCLLIFGYKRKNHKIPSMLLTDWPGTENIPSRGNSMFADLCVCE